MIAEAGGVLDSKIFSVLQSKEIDKEKPDVPEYIHLVATVFSCE